MKRTRFLIIAGYIACIAFAVLACIAASSFSSNLNRLQAKYSDLSNEYKMLEIKYDEAISQNDTSLILKKEAKLDDVNSVIFFDSGEKRNYCRICCLYI